MKNSKLSFRFKTALGLAVLLVVVFSSPLRAAESAVGSAAGLADTTLNKGPDVSSAEWNDIKDCTFDMRAQFFVGLKRLEAKADGQIRELQAKRETLKGTTSTGDWDFAIKEMGDARSFLKSVGEEMDKASSSTWGQQKDSVGQAWLRVQEAYRKVKASTTS